MHRALFLEEILYAIFGYCYPEPKSATRPKTLAERRRLYLYPYSPEQGYAAADLVALASTCRVFKEPALDVLWTELKDITPLARCLPEVCVLKDSELEDTIYTFKRRLIETERETVKKYTRRVRALSIVYPRCLGLESLEDLCLLSMTDPLFPDIRKLYFYIVDQTLPFIHHVVSPKLKSLHLDFAVSDVSSCESFVHSLGPSFPNVKTIKISSSSFDILFGLEEMIIPHICRWTHLQEVDCTGLLSLDIDALFRLSNMPGLTALSFKLNGELTNQIASSNHLLVFSTLQRLQIEIGQIVPISELFMHMQLPAITNISTLFRFTSPPSHVIRSFLMALPKACTSQVMMHLSVFHNRPLDLNIQSSGSRLTIEDIHHFMALNLTSVTIDLDWIVVLKDSDLLEIASMCKRLIALDINEDHGWGPRSAKITPAGLVQFLQRCPFQQRFCIALNTWGCISLPQIQTSGGNPVPRLTTVNIADSFIEAKSVPAFAAFFADFFPQLAHGPFFFKSWGGPLMYRYSQSEGYMKLWQDVFALAKQKLLERSQRSAGGRELLSSESSGE